MAFCVSCGKSLLEGAAFCVNCGEPAATTAADRGVTSSPSRTDGARTGSVPGSGDDVWGESPDHHGTGRARAISIALVVLLGAAIIIWTVRLHTENTSASTGTATTNESGPARAVQPVPRPIWVQNSPVLVGANTPWVDTGVDIPPGSSLYITASGVIRIAGSDPGKYPNGKTVGRGAEPCSASVNFNTPGLTCYALIGKIGSDGTPFEILDSVSKSNPDMGRLYLGVNDDDFSDNSGEWSASVRVCQEATLQQCISGG